MKRFLVVLTLVAVASCSAADPELKGSPGDLANYLANLPRTVSISGEAELKVEADRAAITLKVTTESKSLEEALKENQEARAKIFKMLAERGLPADRVKASRFSSSPRHGVFTDKVKSYKLENLLRVKVRDEQEFRAVAAVTDHVTEAQYVGIEFEHSDKEEMKRRVVNDALDKAANRKRLIEEKLGVTLRPRSLSEHTPLRSTSRRATRV